MRRALARNRTGAAAGILLIAALLCAYAAFTTPQRNWLLNRPLQQIRESAEATRPVLDPFAPENLDILTASFIGPPDPYDANIIPFRSVRELSALIGRADEQGKVLFVNFGFLTTAQLRFRPILNALGDSSLFEKTAELQGFDPINDRFVYRYKPESAAGRNLVAEFQPDQEQGTEMLPTPNERAPARTCLTGVQTTPITNARLRASPQRLANLPA